jgi:succinyl-CoA synthetase beta subunit
MNLHEYQSKKLFREYGLPVLPGYLCYTPGEVEAAADNLGGGVCVVKAQVHAGGRGKGGGVKVAKTPQEAREIAEKMIGMTLITPQTGEKGKRVNKVYVEAGCNIDKEIYLSLLVDRAHRCLSFVASSEGGMDIEEVSHDSPEKILTLPIDPKVGIQSFQALQLGLRLGISREKQSEFSLIISTLYKLFLENDLSLIEVNPFVITKEGAFVFLDAKCAVDDSALFRHRELQRLQDYDEVDPKDLRAGKFGLSYVALDGNIGCMVNGAGLAMATMDIIKQSGGNPANFLDVGGGASKETVSEAFKILLSDSQVKGILVNIFGGIMKCDVIANGIVEAAQELSVKVPLVVRLQGTNVELGREILSKSGLKITPASTMDEAATKIVEAVR